MPAQQSKQAGVSTATAGARASSISRQAPDTLKLTPASKKAKEEELEQLKRDLRKKTDEVRHARSYGDLSENFEYQAARQAQAILNGRIAEIEALLEKAVLVEDGSAVDGKVNIGSRVLLRDLDVEEDVEYTIVDVASADPLNARISYVSPVGSALMGHSAGETVEVSLPNGTVSFEIREVLPG